MRTPFAAAAALVAVLLTGCADDEDPAPATDSGETATSVPPPAEGSAPSSSTLTSVQSDVETLAVSLESFYRGSPYPTTVKEVVASLDDAGLALSPGNTIGSYVYDPDQVEFTLCVENADGAWATYDTAPMSVRGSGAEGGCP